MSCRRSFIELYTGLSGFVPITRWLPVYPYRKNLAADVIASICDAVVATPESITYANIAGLPGVSGELRVAFAYFVLEWHSLILCCAYVLLFAASSCACTWIDTLHVRHI